MTKTKRKKGFFLRATGLLLLAAALCLTLYNIHDELRAARSVDRAARELLERIPSAADEDRHLWATTFGGTPGQSDTVAVPLYKLYPKMTMPTLEVDGNRYIGTLEVKALDLTLPILESWSYANLAIAPCRYTGSAYTGNLVLCGHNYTSHFGPLTTLPMGSEITFTDADGNLFVYETVEAEILSPTAIEEMTVGDWDLTLFTCTLDGRTRFTLRCEMMGEVPCL